MQPSHKIVHMLNQRSYKKQCTDLLEQTIIFNIHIYTYSYLQKISLTQYGILIAKIVTQLLNNYT